MAAGVGGPPRAPRRVLDCWWFVVHAGCSGAGRLLWHKLVCFSHTFQPKKPLPLLRWDLPAETKGADSISGVYWDPLPGAWTGER
jgi:hypothetical protein